jgi:hypothetical protein
MSKLNIHFIAGLNHKNFANARKCIYFVSGFNTFIGEHLYFQRIAQGKGLYLQRIAQGKGLYLQRELLSE